MITLYFDTVVTVHLWQTNDERVCIKNVRYANI